MCVEELMGRKLITKSPRFFVLFYFVSLKIFYSFIHERHTEREAETQAEGEAGSLQGLDPRAPGSRPGPKAGAKPLSHPGCPKIHFKNKDYNKRQRRTLYNNKWDNPTGRI